jgi:hypothetical protein
MSIERLAKVGAIAAWVGAIAVLPVTVLAATDDFGTGPLLGIATAGSGLIAGSMGMRARAGRTLLAVAAVFCLLAVVLTGKGYVYAIPFLVAAVSFLVAFARSTRVRSGRP